MIDIHSHIIFDVDDGPETLEESLALVAEAYAQGVRVIVATSHRRKGMFETSERKIRDNFNALYTEVKKRFSDLHLLYGSELYFTLDMPDKIATKQVPTLNGTRYALIEFSGNTPWRTIQTAVKSLNLIGITPVLAHIERYACLAFKIERVEELIELGALMQINSSSVLKPQIVFDPYKDYKKRAHFFLDHQLVHIVASDMHNLNKRKPYMAQAYELIAKAYGTDMASRLFRENAYKLLGNKQI